MEGAGVGVYWRMRKRKGRNSSSSIAGNTFYLLLLLLLINYDYNIAQQPNTTIATSPDGRGSSWDETENATLWYPSCDGFREENGESERGVSWRRNRETKQTQEEDLTKKQPVAANLEYLFETERRSILIAIKGNNTFRNLYRRRRTNQWRRKIIFRSRRAYYRWRDSR